MHAESLELHVFLAELTSLLLNMLQIGLGEKCGACWLAKNLSLNRHLIELFVRGKRLTIESNRTLGGIAACFTLIGVVSQVSTLFQYIFPNSS